MAQYVGVAKAAQLLGISRRKLQAYMRDGRLETREGRLDVEELRRFYPELQVSDDQAVERARHLKASAFSRRVRETLTPDTDALIDQLKRAKADAAVEKGRADHYREVLEALCERMRVTAEEMEEADRELLYDLSGWLYSRLNE